MKAIALKDTSLRKISCTSGIPRVKSRIKEEHIALHLQTKKRHESDIVIECLPQVPA